MGFNSVAVLLNDHLNEMPPEVREAVQTFNYKERVLDGWFRWGAVVSVAHADDSQVVIVGRNSGVLARKADDVDPWALQQMADCLERHGFRVTKRRKSSDRSALSPGPK